MTRLSDELSGDYSVFPFMDGDYFAHGGFITDSEELLDDEELQEIKEFLSIYNN